MRSYDAATWHFPSISGHVLVSDGAFHFWDAPDDFSCAKLSLNFEGDRLYLHHAQGYFGAVPVTVTGAPSPPASVRLVRFSKTHGRCQHAMCMSLYHSVITASSTPPFSSARCPSHA